MNQTNVFELAAESMKRDEAKAFAGNPPSANHFQLAHATEAKVVGRRYPQTAYINTAIAHLIDFRELSPYPIRFDRIELYKSAKLTDCISTAAISAHAFLLSKKALGVFRQFNLGTYTVYPATVFHKETAHEYGVLHFVNDLQPGLVMEESKFYVANILGGYEFDIDVTDHRDYEAKRQLVKKGEWPGTEEWWYVQLKWGVLQQDTTVPDLFTIFSSSTRPYISRRLAQAIIDNGLTGFAISKVYNLKDQEGTRIAALLANQ